MEVPANNWENVKVAIIGGGAAGLSAAWKFQKNNFNDFVLLELENKIGGTAQSGENSFIGYPWGAHYLPVPFRENVELISLLDEMNLTEGRSQDGEIIVKEQFLCREPEERVFYKGRWYEGLYLNVGASEEDKRQFAEFQKQIDFWVNWRDAQRQTRLRFAGCELFADAEAITLDKISFGDWLRQKGFTSERLFLVLRLRLPRRLRFEIRANFRVGGTFLFLFACPKIRRRITIVYHISRRQRQICQFFSRKNQR